MSFLSVRVATAMCLFFISASTYAENSQLSLRAAMDRSLALHPDLAGFEFAAREQSAISALARLRPSPQLDLELEDLAGSGSYSGFDRAQATLSISQVLELGGKRSQRSSVADARGSRLRTEQAVRQLDVLAEVARRFVNTLAQQERIQAAHQRVELTKRMKSAVNKRVDAAAAPEAERSRAVVALAEAELDLEDARHGLENARSQLAAAMGLAEVDFESLAGDLYAVEEAASFDDLITRLEHSPEFLWFADEQRLREAQLRLARTQARSDIRLSFGLRRTEQTDDTALVAGISLPLFAASRAQPSIDASNAKAEGLSAQKQAAFLTAKAHLRSQYLEMEHAGHVAGVLQKTILPQLERATKQTEQAYAHGRYSFLELSDAQSRLLNARLRRIETAAEYQIHRIAIERLTGESLSDAGAKP